MKTILARVLLLLVVVSFNQNLKCFTSKVKADETDAKAEVAVKSQSHGFVDLFNGKDLTGWSQRNGTATYRVEGDAIVGKTSDGSPNSFLCTDQLYGDFELQFDVKVDPRLNSGVF